MNRMLRYAFIVSGFALALGTATSAQANVAPNSGFVPLFVIRLDTADDDPVGKAIDELHGALKDFIGDVSAMQNMSEGQKIAYITEKFKERVKDKGYKQAYEFAKGKMKDYAESCVRAKAYELISNRVRHEILINGALSNKIWEQLKNQSDEAFEQLFGSLKLLGSGTEIVGGVIWEKFDKIVTNQYSWSEGFLDVLGGVYDKAADAYIPFYGQFKKIVELELALIDALKSYCRNETLNEWIGRVFEVGTLEAGFATRLAKALRGYSSKDQLREIWRRRFHEVTTSGYYMPHTEAKIAEYEAEAWMQVLGVWEEVQKDKALAAQQAKELEQRALTARYDAERKLKEAQEAIKNGMGPGKEALARIDKFLRVDYPKAVKDRATALKQQADQVKSTTDSGAMQGEAFESSTSIIDFVRQFGSQLKSGWEKLTDLPRQVRWDAQQEYSKKLNEVNNKNSSAYSRAYQKIGEKIGQAQSKYQNSQISYDEFKQEEAKLKKLQQDAYKQLEAQNAIIQAEIVATFAEVSAEVSVVADPIVDREVDRIIANVKLSYDVALKDLTKFRDQAAALESPPNPLVEIARFGSSPQNAIEIYELYVEFLSKYRRYVSQLQSIEAQEAKVIEKYNNEIFLQRELYRKVVPAAEITDTRWSAALNRGDTGLTSTYWFSDVRPEVSAKVVEVKPLNAVLKDDLEQAKLSQVQWERNLETYERLADLARPIIPFNAAASRLYGLNAPTSKAVTNSWISVTVDGHWDSSDWKFVPRLETHVEEVKRLIESFRGASVAYDQGKKANYYVIGGKRFDFAEPSEFVNRTGLVDGKPVTMLNPEIIKRLETFFLEPMRTRWQEISGEIPNLVSLGSKIKRYGNYQRSDPLQSLTRVMADSYLPQKIKLFEDGFKDLLARNTAAIEAYDKAMREGQQKADEERKKQEEAEKQRLTEQTPIVRGLYDAFRKAYEARNDSGVAALLEKDWTAPDGTKVSQMQETLRRSFRFFDEVRYEISDLKLVYSHYSFDGQTRIDFYRVSYALTIRGRNFARNIRHEEKSQVVELVAVKDGKALIKQTLEGRTWPGDGRSQ